MKTSTLIVLVLAIIVAGSGGFLGGMKYQENKNPTGTALGNIHMRGNQPPRDGIRAGLRPISGEITNQDDKSITVKLQDGSSKIIILSDATIINKASSGSREDLKAGRKVVVFGVQNSDGSITAQNIQLNPQFHEATGSGTF